MTSLAETRDRVSSREGEWRRSRMRQEGENEEIVADSASLGSWMLDFKSEKEESAAHFFVGYGQSSAIIPLLHAIAHRGPGLQAAVDPFLVAPLTRYRNNLK